MPRILHYRINPSNQRFGTGRIPARSVVDAVVAKNIRFYVINHTDNAQLIDLFTFAGHLVELCWVMRLTGK